MIKQILLGCCLIASASSLFSAEKATIKDDSVLEGIKSLSTEQMKEITGENTYEVLVYDDGTQSDWTCIKEDDSNHAFVIYKDAETGSFIKIEHYYMGSE